MIASYRIRGRHTACRQGTVEAWNRSRRFWKTAMNWDAGREIGRRCTAACIRRCASNATAHETLSGSARQKLLYRAYREFGDPKQARLAGLSVRQLYRLRKSRRYRKEHVASQPTRPAPVAIGGAAAGTEWTAGVFARRHHAPRGSGWSERRVSHQRGG
jgi:hypothetical protein